MAIKHQAESYRNRGGVRFECWADVCWGEEGRSTRDEAKHIVAELRADGHRAFFEKHEGGAYYRIFRQAGATEAERRAKLVKSLGRKTKAQLVEGIYAYLRK